MFDFHGSFLLGPMISSGDARKKADGFHLKSQGKNFLVVLLLPPPTQHLLRFDWEDASLKRGKKFPLMTNVRRVPAILLEILTRLPSGSWVLTPTPTPPLRRENRILWLALQTLLPMSQGAHLCVILGMGRPPCPAFKAAHSYCSQPTESASAQSRSTQALAELFFAHRSSEELLVRAGNSQ